MVASDSFPIVMTFVALCNFALFLPVSIALETRSTDCGEDVKACFTSKQEGLEALAASLLQVRRTVGTDSKDIPKKLLRHMTLARSKVGTDSRKDIPKQLLRNMIRPTPWKCDLLDPFDYRLGTCRLKVDSEELTPELLSCGNDCNEEHANAYRLLEQIGSLPCCPRSSDCAAPSCSDQAQERTTTAFCTPRTPEENLDYMKQADVWPAYHGNGGSFDLDIFKLLDAISFASKGSRAARPFDLMIDLGANYGLYTEKLVQRNFAKSYLMVEANPIVTETLRTRWYNSTWKKLWFEEQAPLMMMGEARMPDFQVINQALSNHSDGELDMCQTEPSMAEYGGNCTVPIASVDSLIPSKLRSQERFKNATSAFIKIDTEGMDELVIRGMKALLEEQRGTYEDGSLRYLVNFLQFEYTPLLMSLAKEREGFNEYDLKTVTTFLESIGFESFLIGPRFLPLSNGSWHDDFRTFTEDPRNNDGKKDTYPDFVGVGGDFGANLEGPSFTADIFAIRSSHPKIKEIKVALGACQESRDFDIKDPQYYLSDLQLRENDNSTEAERLDNSEEVERLEKKLKDLSNDNSEEVVKWLENLAALKDTGAVSRNEVVKWLEVVSWLEDLAALKDTGALSSSEFEAAKAAALAA